MHLAAIYRHPVKSLGSESLQHVMLTAGKALPGDRAYAIAHGKTRFDPDIPGWAECGNFLRIANIPALARPAIAYDPDTRLLSLTDEGVCARYDLSTEEGCTALAAWAGTAAGSIRPGPYFVAEAPGVAMTDAGDQSPSVMSLASLRDLSERVGVSLDPRRFRGNLWIDGDDLEPWAELEWTGRTLAVGRVDFVVTEPIERCLATAANPETGNRSDNPLPALKSRSNDPLFGMLADVRKSGTVAVGDAVTVGE